MAEITALLQKIGFSINEAKVYVALVKKSPINGYEIAKHSGITRTMVYDILNRLVQKNVIICIENDPKLYSPVPYKELIENYRKEYCEELDNVEAAFDHLEPEQNSDNYIKNISDYDTMIDEIRSLIKSARSEIYISIWEDEARLFLDELSEVNHKGVNIISFSFCKIPYDFGLIYDYGIPSAELKKIWNRRRIVVIVDRERIIIGEGNEKIEEISIITSNTMLVEMAIDQVLLDIIHLKELRNTGYLPDDIKNIREYTSAVERFQADLDIDVNKCPRRVDQD